MQEPLELFEQCRIGPFEGLVQGHHNPCQQPILTARRIGNQARRDVIVQLSQKIAYKRRFAAADLAGDHSKAGAVHYAKLQHGERQSVVLAPVDQIWIWQD